MLYVPKNAPKRITGPKPFHALHALALAGDKERATNMRKTAAMRAANRKRNV